MERPGVVKLLSLSSFPSISAVTITPALPAIESYVGGGEAQIQQLISIYLVGYMLGQLPYGPLGHRYGLKRIMLATALLALLTVLLIFGSLLGKMLSLAVILRLILAFLASSGLKVAVAYIAKCYPKEETSKMMAMLSLSFAIGPLLAVFISGYFVDYFGWQGSLYLQILYTIGIYLLFRTLPKEDPEEIEKLSLTTIKTNFLTHFSIPEMGLCGFIAGMSPSVMYAFASVAPFQGISILGLSPSEYGSYATILFLGMFIGGLLGTFINSKTNPQKNIFLFLLLGTLISGGFFLYSTFISFSILSLCLSSGLLIICLSMIQSNATSIALQTSKNESYGASTFTFITMFVAFLTVLIISHISPYRITLLSITYLTLIILGWISYWFLRRLIKNPE